MKRLLLICHQIPLLTISWQQWHCQMNPAQKEFFVVTVIAKMLLKVVVMIVEYFFVNFCTESHKRARSTKHHDLSTVEEIKSNPGPQKIAEKTRCSKHKDEIIKLFCKTCQITICRDCTIVDHQGHKYGFVEDVAEEEKQKIRENLNDVKQRKGRVVEGIVNLEKVKENVEAKKKSTISEIDRHFNELIRSVELKKMEMVEKATSIANSKHKQLDAQLEVLQVALASCESSIGFTERAFESGNNVQILSMEKYILQCLDQLKAVKDETKSSVTDDMKFSVPSSVQERNLNGYDVSDVGLVSPEHCSASFKETEASFTPLKWVLSDVYGNGAIRNDGRTMMGGEGYCWRVGACYFQSGIHIWKVSLRTNPSFLTYSSFQVGIIGCEEINTNVSKGKKKWVLSCVQGNFLLTLNMDKKTLNVNGSNQFRFFSKNFHFTASRVSPFFACDFLDASITLVD